MPNSTQPSQAAREAAWPIWAWLFDGAARDHFMDGDGDDHFLVQAFARFERDTEKRVRESLARREALEVMVAAFAPYAETRPQIEAVKIADAAIHRESLTGEANVDLENGHCVLGEECENLTHLRSGFCAGEANVERVAAYVENLGGTFTVPSRNSGFPMCLSELSKDIRALATLERTTDAG